jgi:transcriptional antiterminator RfaH
MTDDLEWYCLRTKPRNERLTSNFLRVENAVEVFCPFVRFERARRSGKLWVTEAMFPGYVFARFRYISQCRQIRATRGVVKIVSFGEVPARVSSEIIGELRNAVQDQETIVIQPGIEVGEEVNVIAGPFRGLRVVVSRVMPARERIAVLLEVLGMEREVEISFDTVIADTPHPMTRAAAQQAPQ